MISNIGRVTLKLNEKDIAKNRGQKPRRQKRNKIKISGETALCRILRSSINQSVK